jgi:hypothetical protein
MLDMVVGALHAAGFEWADALRGAMAVYVYVVGSTIEEQAMPPLETLEQLQGEFPDRDRHPSLAAAFADFELDPDAGFERGLGLMLAGLRSSLIKGTVP